jgi:hypothetical protein
VLLHASRQVIESAADLGYWGQRDSIPRIYSLPWYEAWDVDILVVTAVACALIWITLRTICALPTLMLRQLAHRLWCASRGLLSATRHSKQQRPSQLLPHSRGDSRSPSPEPADTVTLAPALAALADVGGRQANAASASGAHDSTGAAAAQAELRHRAVTGAIR